MIIACPHCGQEISAEDISGKFACLHCGGHILLAKEQPPIIEHPKAEPSPAAHHSKPPPKSRIFYYVFWGTISLFGTLALLVVGFLFFSAAGAAFLSARNASKTSVATTPKRYLPPLTQDEQAEATRLMSQFRVHRDDVESITWYKPPSGDGYRTAVYLYIGTNTNDEPWLRWCIRYYGKDWLFIRSFRIKVDEAEAENADAGKGFEARE